MSLSLLKFQEKRKPTRASISYLYGLTDIKYPKHLIPEKKKEKPHPLSSYKFRLHDTLQTGRKYDWNDVPIVFKTSPEPLYELAANVLDKIPLPEVYTWSIKDVGKWLKRIGFEHYEEAFKANFINGKRLLYLDASALSAINIKNFDDIRRLTYHIRSLFVFELTKHPRCLTLPSHYYNELYKLYRAQTGRKYDLTKPSHLWREMGLLRPRESNKTHWEQLEEWLKHEPDTKPAELIGLANRRNMYKCKSPPKTESAPARKCAIVCSCMPPCGCHWTERDLHEPWILSCLPQNKEHSNRDMGNSLKILCEHMPAKYGWYSKRSIARPEYFFIVVDEANTKVYPKLSTAQAVKMSVSHS